MTKSESKPVEVSQKVYRVLYGAFILFAVYFLVRGEIMEAASNLGIALIFDPFNGLKWEERKTWMKGWLFVHVAVVSALFGIGIWG
jgi:hypothetical protein